MGVGLVQSPLRTYSVFVLPIFLFMHAHQKRQFICNSMVCWLFDRSLSQFGKFSQRFTHFIFFFIRRILRVSGPSRLLSFHIVWIVASVFFIVIGFWMSAVKAFWNVIEAILCNISFFYSYIFQRDIHFIHHVRYAVGKRSALCAGEFQWDGSYWLHVRSNKKSHLNLIAHCVYRS